MSKVVCLDLGSIIHTAIFQNYAMLQKQQEGKIAEDAFIPSSSYNFMNSLISMLKRIGIAKDDIVIMAGDGRNSFRRAFYYPYKRQRKEFREKFDIDWSVEYRKTNKTISQIADATNFSLIWESGTYNYLDLINTPEGEKYINVEEINEPLDVEFSLEADDIASVVSSFYKDKEVILVTKDADWDMLTVKPNVKIFSMNTKWRGGTGVYKPIENGYKILEKKVRCGDVSDNILVDKENDTERDKEIRKLIIDLINLPEWVTKPIEDILKNLSKKETDFSLLPFQKSLARRFPQIYSTEKIITYEDCLKRLERKKVRIKNKKKKMKKTSTMRK